MRNFDDLKDRTFKFSIEIISFIESLPENRASKVISYQILKSATSVGQITEQRKDQEVTKNLFQK
jgi:four helix bundle protein